MYAHTVYSPPPPPPAALDSHHKAESASALLTLPCSRLAQTRKDRRSIVVLILALLISIGGSGASAQQLYTVQPGDALLHIALQNGITLEALAAANGIPSPFDIQAGARIWVVDSSDPTNLYYVTQPGDNLFRIALRFGATPESLAAANELQPPYTIHAGNLLIVPAPYCPPEEGAAPAAAVDDRSSDPNLCYSKWTDCGDGGTPESACRWKVGWCVANLGKTAEDCRCLFSCGKCPQPELPPPSYPEPEEPDKPAIPKAPEPRCVLQVFIDDQGNEHTSARWTNCFKLCREGYSDEDLERFSCPIRQ